MATYKAYHTMLRPDQIEAVQQQAAAVTATRPKSPVVSANEIIRWAIDYYLDITIVAEKADAELAAEARYPVQQQEA